MTKTTQQIVEEYHKTVLEAGNFALLDKYVAANVIFHSPYLSSPLKGRDKFTEFIMAVFSAISDLQVTTNEVIAQDNRASVRWTIEGVSSKDFMNIPAGGDNRVICIMSQYHLKNGKITEAWAVDSSLWPRVFDF
jgi:steroid delta-isomerase-like uncharacterized protein